MEIPVPASFCLTLRAFAAPQALGTVVASSGARARAGPQRLDPGENRAAEANRAVPRFAAATQRS